MGRGIQLIINNDGETAIEGVNYEFLITNYEGEKMYLNWAAAAFRLRVCAEMQGTWTLGFSLLAR